MVTSDSFNSEIAIIGIAGRFPGAKDVSEFWQNLQNSTESISFFTDRELEESGVDSALLNNPNYVKANGALEQVDLFDASFFGYSPKEAEIMDPQHRIFLECASEALENAAYRADTYQGLVGVYAGANINTYLFNIYSQENLLASVTNFQIMIANDKDYLPTRTSYKLNLKGPSINVNTACSTSLVAVHMACQSLLSGECDIVLAGGVSVGVPQKIGYLYQEGGIHSPDGHCRAFDAKAQGTVDSNGVGIVVLKRLADALADGDCIHAVIKGSAINNDGSLKVGYTAPSVDGQTNVIADALAIAGVEAETISYIEAHGTGTTLGDPIEIAALTQAFRASTDKKGFCAIGSVKTNVGHLGAAAGVTGLIKTVLALKHKLLLPNLHFNVPNPQIDFVNSPFYINTKLSKWKVGKTPRRAGVSSFGIGGTNAHVILEEAPPQKASGKSRPYELLLLSAKTLSALETATANLAQHLKQHPENNLADVAYTLGVGRRAFSHRRMLVCQQVDDAVSALETVAPQQVFTAFQKRENPPVVFMFPGQGAQYINMAKELYDHEPRFQQQVDLCAKILQPLIGIDLRLILYPLPEQADQAKQQLEQTQIAQPALFVIEYALAQLWKSWGVHPQAMIGHSIGEYVCGCLSGVLSLTDALSILALRGQLMQQLPKGSMLMIPLHQNDVLPLLNNELSLAAVNSPLQCVVSGSTPAIDSLEQQLASQNVKCRRLHTSHAFHSQMMEPILQPFAEGVKKLSLNPPDVPYLSTLTGTWITPDQATAPSYWASHLRSCVLFDEALQKLFTQPDFILLEVGPGRTLSTFALRHPQKAAEQIVLSSLAHPKDQQSNIALLSSLGKLWLAGVDLNWTQFYAHQRRHRLPLPTYPFERQRYWIEFSKVKNQETLPKKDIQQEKLNDLMSLSMEIDFTSKNIKKNQPITAKTSVATTSKIMRQGKIMSRLKTVFSRFLGVDPVAIDASISFLEMGADSLVMIQVNQAIQEEFGVKLSFRNLLDELTTIDALATYINQQLPPEESLTETSDNELLLDASVQQIPPKDFNTEEANNVENMGNNTLENVGNSTLERVIAQQLQTMSQLMSQQLNILNNNNLTAEILPPSEKTQQIFPQPGGQKPAQISRNTPQLQKDVANNLQVASTEVKPSQTSPGSFVSYRPTKVESPESLNSQQQEHLEKLIARYTERTQKSKQLTQTYRSSLADTRVSTRFRLRWKEMVYPIIGKRALDSKIWDVDDNEYIDLTMGFGVHLFGHSPPFILKALEEQLNQGILSIGPQSRLAGQVSELICQMTGNERVTFCNSGTEAVMTALRLARAVTRRSKIALFVGAYHGSFDGTLVRKITVDGEERSLPIAPGVTENIAKDTLVLDYGTPETLEILKNHVHSLAAVLVEPVQSRQPELQPQAFLQQLRQLTERAGTALIFDEIITGFRSHPGGAQAWFGVKADIVTYGKVVGGGLPIGVVAGKAIYMDAIDGGFWNYGDDSFPQAQQTFFAGTFCKHPLAMATALVTLNHLKYEGPALQQKLNQRTSQLADILNSFFEREYIPIRVLHFSSFFCFSFLSEFNFIDLFFYHLIEKGIYIWEGGICFLSTAHTEEDINYFVLAVKDSVREMQNGGFLQATFPRESKGREVLNQQHNNEYTSNVNISFPLSDKTVPPIAIHSGIHDTNLEKKGVKTLPLTEAQRHLWIATQIDDKVSIAYNEPQVLLLHGPFNLSAMHKAFQKVVNRHEALRTTFSPEGNYQQILPNMLIEVPCVDSSYLDQSKREVQVKEWIVKEIQQPFDLVHGPLVRIKILKLDEQQHILVFTFHHLIFDAWSLYVLKKDLDALYLAECQNITCQLPHAMQYSEYIQRLEQQNQNAKISAETYLLKQFADSASVLELPTDRPRPAVKTYNGAQEFTIIDNSLHNSLKSLSLQQDCTLFMTLLSGYNLLLHKLTGQKDIVVGINLAGQPLIGGENLVGFCINLLPLKSQVAREIMFLDYLKFIKEKVLDAYEHQNYHFSKLINKLNLRRDPSRSPLFTVAFSLEPAPDENLFGLQAEEILSPFHGSKWDCSFTLIHKDSELRLVCTYNTDLFNSETIQRWMKSYEIILHTFVTQPKSEIKVLEEIFSLAEKQEQSLQLENLKKTSKHKFQQIKRKSVQVKNETDKKQ